MQQWLGEGTSAAARSRLAAAAVFSTALHAGVMFGVGVGGDGKDARHAIESAPELRVKLAAQSPAKLSRPQEAQQEQAISRPSQSSPTDAAPGPGGAVSAPRYFFSSELGKHPTVLAPIVPRYPDQLQTGPYYVRLRVFINEHGAVDDVVVVNADPNGVFERAARAAFAQAHFLPGQRDGVPVRSQMLVEVKFDPGIDVRLADEPAPNASLPGRQATQADTVPSAARAR